MVSGWAAELQPHLAVFQEDTKCSPCGLLPRLLRDEDGVSEAHRCFAAINLAELSVVWSCQS